MQSKDRNTAQPDEDADVDNPWDSMTHDITDVMIKGTLAAGRTNVPTQAGRAHRADDARGSRPGAPAQGAQRPSRPGLAATLRRTAVNFKRDNGTDWAAALTYYGVLSIFPALLALVSMVGLVADPHTITENLTKIATRLGPASAADTLRGPIESVTANRGGAGVLMVVGILSALWTASGYIGAFTRISNVIYEVEEGRPAVKLRPLQLAVTLVQVLLLALVATSLVVTGPLANAVGSAFGIGRGAVLTWEIAKWPVMAAVVLLLIGLLYYAAPNAKLRGFRSVLPGAVLALSIWAIASSVFAVYVSHFGSYNKTYGTLGGIITFLVWLWLTNIAVVLGAQFNAERERSKEIAEGRPGAEQVLQIQTREEPKRDNRPTR